MEYLFIYLLQLSDVFDFLLISSVILIILLIIVLIIGSFIHFSEPYFYYKEKKQGEKILQEIKKYTIISFVAFMVLALIPRQKTLLLFGGTYLGKKAVSKVVTNEKLQKIDKIINLELDKRIKELEK